MSHFARVIRDSSKSPDKADYIVQQIIVAEQDFIDNFVGTEPGEWIQCSYNTRAGVHKYNVSKALRKNYPSPGWLYDGIGFYPPKPHDSWVFNTSTYLWEPPKQYPKDGKTYHWDESKKDWVELGGIA